MSDIKKTGKIAVIGDAESVTAFRAIGADTFAANDSYKATDILRDLIRGDYAVIFITENLACNMETELETLKARPFPVVIPVPCGEGVSGYGMKAVKRDVEKAIGVDILNIN